MNSAKKHAIVVFFLWVFAPVAWVIMWRDKNYHSWFPTLMFVNGIVFTIMFLSQYFLLMPKISHLMSNYDIQTINNVNNILAFALVIFALAQVAWGFYLRGKVAKDESIVGKYITLILIIFSIDSLLGLATGLANILLPINKLGKLF